MLSASDTSNFATLTRAFEAGHVALLDVRRTADKRVVAAVCAVNLIEDEFAFTPFALMVEGNPFDLLEPPDPDGGFVSVKP